MKQGRIRVQSFECASVNLSQTPTRETPRGYLKSRPFWFVPVSGKAFGLNTLFFIFFPAGLVDYERLNEVEIA